MSLLSDFFTPKDTEEIKPNLFVKKKRDGQYAVVNPVYWNGKFRKESILGRGWLVGLIMAASIIYLAWSYKTDMNTQHDFYTNLLYNPEFSRLLCDAEQKQNLTLAYGFNVTYYCDWRNSGDLQFNVLPDESLFKSDWPSYITKDIPQ